MPPGGSPRGRGNFQAFMAGGRQGYDGGRGGGYFRSALRMHLLPMPLSQLCQATEKAWQVCCVSLEAVSLTDFWHHGLHQPRQHCWLGQAAWRLSMHSWSWLTAGGSCGCVSRCPAAPTCCKQIQGRYKFKGDNLASEPLCTGQPVTPHSLMAPERVVLVTIGSSPLLALHPASSAAAGLRHSWLSCIDPCMCAGGVGGSSRAAFQMGGSGDVGEAIEGGATRVTLAGGVEATRTLGVASSTFRVRSTPALPCLGWVA